MTGLTTGGLSCLAVQGGLLASALSRQVEGDLPAARAGKRCRRQTRRAAGATDRPLPGRQARRLHPAGLPARALGSVLQLNPLTRAILQFAIGIFMVGNALRMLNVHPIFRYFRHRAARASHPLHPPHGKERTDLSPRFSLAR